MEFTQRSGGRRTTQRGSAGVTVVGLLSALVACGSSKPTATSGASTPSAQQTTVASSSAASGGASASASGGVSASASVSASALANGVVEPCALVTPTLLKSTIGTTVAAGKLEPTTVVGTGCRFTSVTASGSVNIVVETTNDPADQLSGLAYSPPAGSSSVPGSDRGYLVAPAIGTSTGAIMIVKGGSGVFVTLFQDKPPLTVAGEQKLAAAVVAQL